MQWEYAGEEILVSTYLHDPLERCMVTFNEMGSEGWELVCSASAFDPERKTERIFGIFKRPKQAA